MRTAASAAAVFAVSVLILLIASCTLMAQGQIQLGLPSQEIKARPGGTADLTATMTDTTGRVSGLQWDLQLPSGWTFTASPGPVLGAPANKTLACHQALCVVYGLNRNIIPAGIVARHSVTIPAAQSPGSFQLALGSVMASDDAGRVLPVAAGTGASIRVLARADVNGDGSTTEADVGLVVDMALKRTACTPDGDQNGDGKCEVFDILLVVLSFLGVLP